MVAKFNNLIASKEYSWKLEDILPKVLSAGENAVSSHRKAVKNSMHPVI